MITEFYVFYYTTLPILCQERIKIAMHFFTAQNRARQHGLINYAGAITP